MRQAGFCYRPDEWVFRDYSFAVDRNEVVAILGPNGRGKTTLLKSLMGLVRLKEGTVHMDGEFGYVPQSHQVPFSYTVLDMVVMGRARHIGLFSTPARSDFEAARQALARLSIGHFAERPFNRLSAGERQLVMIARALASDCQVLILDEPTSSLDFRNQNHILQTLRQISRSRSITIVFATHVPQHAALIAGQVLLMSGPRDYLFGPSPEVMTDRNLSRLYNLEVRHLTFTHRDREVQAVVPIFR